MVNKKASWNKTICAAQRLGLKNSEEELYQGRFIIHRDSPVDGGVCIGQCQREAIVVDSSKSPLIRKLYDGAKSRATQDGVIMKNTLLRAVYDTVAEAMPTQDYRAVKEIIRRCGVERDGKISLDVFLEEGVGVCRHDALACAIVLELFKREGITHGKASVDRNCSFLGGHTWCRYVNSVGEVFILDVAQGYLGRLKDAPDDYKQVYQRPEELLSS